MQGTNFIISENTVTEKYTYFKLNSNLYFLYIYAAWVIKSIIPGKQYTGIQDLVWNK